MAKRIEILFEGQMVPAEQLEFESEKEPFSLYRLEDGTVIKLKTILASVSRVLDRYHADGNPIYVMNVGGMPVLDVPTELGASRNLDRGRVIRMAAFAPGAVMKQSTQPITVCGPFSNDFSFTISGRGCEEEVETPGWEFLSCEAFFIPQFVGQYASVSIANLGANPCYG